MSRKSGQSSKGHVLIHQGDSVAIYALRLPKGSCPAQDFLKNELSDTERATMGTAFEMLGMQGFIRNSERFKKLEDSDGVFEFKDFQVRIFCCWAGQGRMFLLYGVKKKKNKHKSADVDRAEKLAEYAKKQSMEKNG